MKLELGTLRDSEFDLDGLAEAARMLLSRGGVKVDDGRVAATVDGRGIRYYQTLGVIDRPRRYEGRRAIYDYRHLLQLLATRQLQREGYPLSVIQSVLPGKTTAELESSLRAVLASKIPTLVDTSPAGAPSAPPELPSPPAGAPGSVVTFPSRAPSPEPPRRVLTGDIAPGITLSIDSSLVADADELFARLASHLARALQED